MKYKNIVFDFGNVIGRFDGKRSSQNSAHMKKNWIIYPKSFINAGQNLTPAHLIMIVT